MRTAVFMRDQSLARNPRYLALAESLEGSGRTLYRADPGRRPEPDTDLVLAVGGDGTFLSAAALVGDSGIPVLGVNLGRLGFLSEYTPETVSAVLPCGFSVEHRSLVGAFIDGKPAGSWPYALNEVSFQRTGAAMLGIDVKVDGVSLPTYWADGLIVATSSGSTAYSLSVGGPIALPDTRVLIISPISPHNLNVRPLVVPDSAVVEVGFRSRDREVSMSVDNRSSVIPADSSVQVRMAQFSLNRARLGDSDFISALTSKLFWGEDMRNLNEQ